MGMGRRQKDSAHPPEVRPVDVDGVRTVAIVTVGWGVAFVALALRQGQLNDAGNGWWLWTCLAGVGLGLLGLEYCRKRRDAIAQAALDAEAESGEFEDDSAVGDWSRLPPEEPDFGVEAQPQPDEQQVSAEGDHVTQPYQQAERPPGYTTGDMPVVPGQSGQPVAGYPGTAAYAHGQSSHPEYAEPNTPPPPASEPAPPRHYEQAPQRPVERPRPQPAPPPTPTPAPAPQQQPSMPTEGAPSRPAAHRPAPPQRAPQPPAQQPPQPPPSPPQQAPTPQPEPAPQDPYSTGADWYDSAAGYTPDADRARQHPRDRRPEAPQPSGPAAEPPGRERQGRRPLEDSEFFGDESNAPPPNSTAEFLLADLEDGDDEQAPPARHDRDAPDDEYRGRRTRRSR